MSEMAQEQDPANRVRIFDTTLRDGEQSPGIALNKGEKVDIAHRLGRLGVDVIEAGFPITSPGDFEAVQAIARGVEGPVICGLARTHKGDIDAAWHAIKDSERPRIHTFISTSDIHIKHQLQTDRKDVKGQTKAAVAMAKSYTDDVEFSPMDATRAEKEFNAEVVQIAIDEGATVINIPDTVGYTTPDEYREHIEFLRQEVKGSENVRWSVHCHNDLGLAVANSYAGILGGARQVECAVNGIGERAGNCSLEEIVMLLRTRRDVTGVDTTIDTPQIGPTSRMVSRLTGYPIQFNKAIVGRNAFSHESGIHQDGVLKERTTYEIMDAKDVGNDAQQIVLGKHSGRHAVREVLSDLGIFDETTFKKTFKLFKGFADKVGGVSEDQLTEINDEAKRRNSADFEFEDHNLESRGNYDRAKVAVVNNKSGEKIVAEAESDPKQRKIDGPIDAILKCVKAATDTDFEVVRVNHESIGKGESAIDRAYVEIKINGETVIGHGLSTNTLKAAGCAYIDAVMRVKDKKSET